MLVNKSNFFMLMFQSQIFWKFKLISKSIRSRIPSLKKHKISKFNKLIFFWKIQKITQYSAHKAFIRSEMQINSLLVRAKLVPILAIVPALCFYRLIFTKQKVIRRADYVVSLNETIFIPLFLYGAFSSSIVQISFFPAYLAILVTGFIKITEVNVFSKVWMLSNFYILPELAAVTVFEYPNIVYYEKPFKKFTKIFFKQNPTIAIKTYKIAKRTPDKKILYRKPVYRHRPLFHYATYTLVKLRLFDYVSFYA